MIYIDRDILTTLRPRQNGRRFADDVFKCIFLNENVWISFKISLKFVPKDPINTIPVLVQILAWRRSGDKPLSEPMTVSLLTHICPTRSQWVNHHARNTNMAAWIRLGIRIFCVWLIWTEVTLWFGNNTIISYLSIDRHSINIRITAWPKLGMHANKAIENFE